MSKISTTIRRWCDVCGWFTRSEMRYGEEVCAEHTEPDEDDW